MPENLNELIDEAERLREDYKKYPHDIHRAFAFSDAADAVVMPLIDAYRDLGNAYDGTVFALSDAITARDKLAAEIETLKPAANAWNALFATIGALADLDEKPDAPKDERLNDYIRAWAAKQQECDKLAAELDRLRAQAERYRLDALRLAAKVDPEEFSAEWESEIADLRTVREDLANERAVRAVQAGKLAHAARLVPKPHEMSGFDDPDAPDEVKSLIESAYAFWGIEDER